MERFDVVVVGVGAAGLAAAIEAHDAGARVIVLEKGDAGTAGGNTRVSGQIWFSPTDVDAAKVHLRALSGRFPVPDDVTDAWAGETACNTAWLRARAGEVAGQVPRHPDDDYSGDHTDIFALDFEVIARASESCPAGDVPRYELPELVGNECGTEYHFLAGMGMGRVWRMLMTALADREVPVRYSSPVTRLVTDADGVVVAVETGGDDPVTIAADRGVVLATGGFAANREMTRTFLRLDRVVPWGSPLATGDGIRLAQHLGAGLSHPYNYMDVQGIAMPELGVGENVLPKEHRFVNVGADGRRFHDDTEFARHGKIWIRGQFDFHPGHPYWTVFDEDGRLAGPLVDLDRAVGWAKQVLGYRWSDDNQTEIDRGWIVRADSLPELAERLGIDAEGLVDEIGRYNERARSGTGDPEFGRLAGTMTPIDRPPFYGYEWGQVCITTLGGLRKDGRARVLDVDGEVIPRLYCAGDVASTYTWSLSGGMGLGDALAFGRIAGREASRSAPIPG